MPQVASPRWSARRRRWIANIGDVGSDGRRREVQAPAAIAEGDEAGACAWLAAERTRRGLPAPPPPRPRPKPRPRAEAVPAVAAAISGLRWEFDRSARLARLAARARELAEGLRRRGKPGPATAARIKSLGRRTQRLAAMASQAARQEAAFRA